MKKITLIAVALSSIVATAQTTNQNDRSHFGPENPIMCGQHIQQAKHFEEHPEHKAIYEAEQAAFQAQYEYFLENEYDPNARSTYVVPVVVHVVHLGGADNISDEHIDVAIDPVIFAFYDLNNDLTNIVPAFSANSGNPIVNLTVAYNSPLGNSP